jgi:hypothetical protein
MSLILASLLALAVIGSPVTSAQTTGEAFCAALTAEEVGAALGTDVTATPDEESCSWSASDPTTFTFLDARWDSSSLDELKTLWTGGTPLSIAGHDAYFVSDYGLLYVQLDQGVLALQLAMSGDADQQAALAQLGELIVPRAGTLPAPPTPEPARTPAHADTDLEALFPRSVAGQALTIESQKGSETFSSDTEGGEELLAQLAADGKTLDDLSVATGYSADFKSIIYAIKVDGVDAAKYAPLLIATLEDDTQQAAGQVAGKDVTVLTSPSGSQYLYPHNDVIWVVSAAEPGLSEIFNALP